MKYISTILVCAGLWPAATVCAQNGGEKDSTLNRTVVVENQYNPEVMDAFKVNVMPEVEETATRRRTSVRLKAPMRMPTDTTTATVSG